MYCTAHTQFIIVENKVQKLAVFYGTFDSPARQTTMIAQSIQSHTIKETLTVKKLITIICLTFLAISIVPAFAAPKHVSTAQPTAISTSYKYGSAKHKKHIGNPAKKFAKGVKKLFHHGHHKAK